MIYASEQGILNARWNAAEIATQVEIQRLRPFMLIRPNVYQDGDKWCALYGPDIQIGVCGFGDTPEAAAIEFDKAWSGK